ncbi:RIO kinase 2 [Paragonimus westermani]|uniref:non-specific serine/threonine protein kinase n=1 Tax=Paragonimus westermani TaxID=34504 RepID=A0A5J4NJC5_9TREM|nr:RIO kinase 2 [Paragonimus westermani]
MPKTIRLDAFHYVTNEAWRALIAIEMGLKNHEVVPVELAQKISRCKRNSCGFIKLIKDQLIANSLVAYETDSRKCASGYRLTNLGYDYLALHQLFVSGQLADLGSMIGAGKESDVYLAVAGAACGVQKGDSSSPLVVPGSPVVVKFHRLGRTSFRKVKEKRDYHQHRNTCSWLYLDRLASQREFSMMKAKKMLCAICAIGLVHGDYNEFNLMVVGLSEVDFELSKEPYLANVRLVLIDFPQMVSREHPSADSLYQRDSDGIVSFFGRFFDIQNDDLPMPFKKVIRTAHADVEVKAPGYNSTRRGHRIAVKDILLGSTTRRETSDESVQLNSTDGDDYDCSSESDSRDESVEEKDEAELSEISPVNDVISGSSSALDAVSTLDKKMKMLKVSKIKSSGVIDLEVIRARHKRERRHQEQVIFQRNIKRHARANAKRQGRASLKAELTIFG